ncbi:MAG: hypothetical protein H6811_09305 [Phycisphaeraceae bacterium]|nr:hypothetical protein [Phycisphaeraceae bacterium]
MALIEQLGSAGAMPALEALVRFAGQRQRYIAANIANLDTPDYRPVDLDPRAFQKALGEAIQHRRDRTGGAQGSLDLGMLERSFEPSEGSAGGVLFHDRGNRNLERLMQSLAENGAVFRTASELLKSRVDVLKAAIREQA